MTINRTAWAMLWVFYALIQITQGQVECIPPTVDQACVVEDVDVSSGCATTTAGICSFLSSGNVVCATRQTDFEGNVCDQANNSLCSNGICLDSDFFLRCEFSSACPDGVDMCDDPHMKGLRGQKIDWSGIDGGWYSLVHDAGAQIDVNVRLTAPLPDEFPDRQLITGLGVVSEGRSLVIEVEKPYQIKTKGCPRRVSPCLLDGGLRACVDGEEIEGLLRFARDEYVADGIIVSASNLPAECRQFGGDMIWARMYDEMIQGTRQLGIEKDFEQWILRFDDTAAPDWCTQYIKQHDLAELQSTHAVFKIVTPTLTVRLNVGANYQGGGELDWDGRVLLDLEVWQMDVGTHGLSLRNESLSGILGETARPVLDGDGRAVMEGYEAFRGTVEDHRVSGPQGTTFDLLNKL